MPSLNSKTLIAGAEVLIGLFLVYHGYKTYKG